MFLLVSFLLTCSMILKESSAHNLTFLFITSFGQSGFNASGVVPAADIALEDINSHQNVLSGYTLMYDQVRDSQCHRSQSLNAFFDGIFMDPPRKLAVIGCGCSVATEPVAEISHQWNISQISYASTSAALSNRNKYKSFFRNTFNMKIIAPALRSAVAYFNWSRIAVLTQDEGLFTETEYYLMSEFEEANIEVKTSLFRTGGNPTDSIAEYFSVDNDYRVFFLNCYSEAAREIICYAHRNNYTYPRYAWILYGWYPNYWWVSNELSACKANDLKHFLERALAVDVPPFSDGKTDIGTSQTAFSSRYEAKAKNGSYIVIDQAYKLYDALWVLALALNSTDAMIRSGDINETDCEELSGALLPLEEFDYSNRKIGCLIQHNIQTTNFSGITGRVIFDEQGTRIQTTAVFYQCRLQGGQINLTIFAQVDSGDNYTFTLMEGVANSDIYPDGAPLDGTPLKIIHFHTFDTWLIVIFDIFASLGIIFAIICLIFNFTFRKRKTVRLSSPTLNYFIIGGAVLMYTSIFFYLLPTEKASIIKFRCVAEYWLFTVGYSLAFGAVFVKMWRIYQIFHNPKPNRKAFGVREEYCVWVCHESTAPAFYWQIVVFAYLIMLQIVGIVLAFQTRKVKLSGLRDSKYIATIIYISSISMVVMTLVTFILESYIHIGTGMFVFGILALTTLFLVLIFVPKMVLLYKDPRGKNSGLGTSQTDANAIALSSQMKDNKSTAELELKVTLLEKTVQENEQTIAELKNKIETLDSTEGNVQNTCTHMQ